MTNSSLDFIFVVIFLYLNNQDKFEKDKTDAFDDTENKPNDALVDDTEKFVPGEEFVFILDSEPMPSPRQSPVPPVHGEDGTSVDDEDLPPPPPTTEPPIESPTPDSDLLNGNKDLSVDVSQSDNLDNSSLNLLGLL